MRRRRTSSLSLCRRYVFIRGTQKASYQGLGRLRPGLARTPQGATGLSEKTRHEGRSAQGAQVWSDAAVERQPVFIRRRMGQ